jgi:pyruvate,water dikinase
LAAKDSPSPDSPSAGLPVPNGFHITTAAYQDFVSQHQIGEMIQAQLAAGDAASQASAIAALFADRDVPAEIAAAVAQGYHWLGSPPVAVRSSATAEDLPGGLLRRSTGEFPECRWG